MLLVFVLLVVVVRLVLMLQHLLLTRRQAALASKLKTNIRALPFLGHSYKFLGTNEHRMNALHELGRDAIECGGISKSINLGHLFICVADPVAAKVLLNQCLEKHDFMKILEFAVGNAAIVAPVPIWRHRRKIDSMIFNLRKLRIFVETFSEHSHAMVDLLEKEVKNGTFSLWEYLAVSIRNALFETVTGDKSNCHGTSEFLKAVGELWTIAMYRSCQPWLQSHFLFKLMPCCNTAVKHKRTVYDFIAKIIREKQRKLTEKSSAADTQTQSEAISFLDFQLSSSNSSRKLSEEELVEEILMLLTGYDVTTTSAGYVILALCRHQHIQEKVYKELQAVFGESDRAVTHEDLPRLTYLEAVIKETLRLYPSVPAVIRHVDKDVTLPSGLTIVKDCSVLVNIWAVHRNPGYWGEDAEQFWPERFLSYSPAHPAQYMAFSYGARNCIGTLYSMMLLKCLLSTLLRRYRVLAPPGVAPAEPLRTKFEMLSKHVDNFEVQLEHRTSNK